MSGDLAQSIDGSAPSWLGFTLDQVYCIAKVIRYDGLGNEYQSWTCTEINCEACVSLYCSDSVLEVSMSNGNTGDSGSISDCKHGNIVTLTRTGPTSFRVFEIAILRKPGEKSFCLAFFCLFRCFVTVIMTVTILGNIGKCS